MFEPCPSRWSVQLGVYNGFRSINFARLADPAYLCVYPQSGRIAKSEASDVETDLRVALQLRDVIEVHAILQRLAYVLCNTGGLAQE